MVPMLIPKFSWICSSPRYLNLTFRFILGFSNTRHFHHLGIPVDRKSSISSWKPFCMGNIVQNGAEFCLDEITESLEFSGLELFESVLGTSYV